MGALIVVGILVLVGLGIWYSWYAKKKRREELAIAAKQLGLQYSAEDVFGCLALPFGLLDKGDGRGTENVLWGAWQGMDLREFDYWYYDETTDSEGHTSRSYSHFSCAVTQTQLTAAPLSVTRENIFTRFADHVGLRDIEFESEQFNREFNVKSGDRKFDRRGRRPDDAVAAADRRRFRVRDERAVRARVLQAAPAHRADAAARRDEGVPRPPAEGGVQPVRRPGEGGRALQRRSPAAGSARWAAYGRARGPAASAALGPGSSRVPRWFVPAVSGLAGGGSLCRPGRFG
jgi:hypothetical protein